MPLSLTSQVADVDKPLLSVAQIVHSGVGKATFSKEASYIEYPSGRRDPLEFRDGLYVLKLLRKILVQALQVFLDLLAPLV